MTFSSVFPAMTEWVPQELLPIMPPRVLWLWVAGSGPKRQMMALRFFAQPVQNDAGLHACCLGLRIEVD